MQPELGRVTLTADQIYTIDASPIQAVAAIPGSVLLPTAILYRYLPGTIPFATSNAQFAWQWGDDGFDTGSATAVAFDLSGLTERVVLNMPSDDVDNHQGLVSDLVGQPIMVTSPAPIPKAGSLLTLNIVSPGNAYEIGDTGTLVGSISGTGATYVVETINEFGNILTLTITDGGGAYTFNEVLTPVNAGAQPGIGHDAVMQVTTTDGSISADGEVEMIVLGIASDAFS